MIAFGLLGGLVLLYLGGEALVRGGSALALRMGVKPLMVGLTVVAMGTSTPELVVSMGAAFDGFGGIALGNVIGSNIANIALILGISAVIRPMQVQSKLVRLDMPIALAVAVLLVVVVLDGELSRLDGVLLFTGFLAYIAFTIWEARRDRAILDSEPGAGAPTQTKPLVSVLLILAGLGLLVLGGRLFVEAAVTLAAQLGVPDSIVGLTIVAIGTSLPELATSIIAAVRGESDLSIGNVVGSNIFNVLCILGLVALVRPFAAGQIEPVDLMVMVGLTVILLPMLFSGFRVTRLEGVFLLALYAGYMVYLATSNRAIAP